MASFTDNQLPRFNPYIQQQPVEAMVTVGTQRQKAHDEGVQKIQGQIDNLAGIQVGRDVDKAYLQSKINELGNNLRSVAGGDFSNFQLVNSTGGMIKQISYDPFIKAAVSSTANDAKQLEDMEADRKAGKLTPHAEYYYGLKRNKYYSNGSLKDEKGQPVTYNGKYIQSWDIDKHIIEAIKGVGDSKWSADNVFKMVNGQIAKDANGAPIYSDYAIREIRQGKFSENVATAIDTVLSRPEASQELAMRGIYKYRGYNDINSFIDKFENQKRQAINTLEDKRLDMMEKVANASTAEEKAVYQAQVTNLESRIEGVRVEAEKKIQEAQGVGSVDAYKAMLETMETRNQYLKSGVTETISTEIIENIPYKAAQQRIKDERDWWVQRDASARGWANVKVAQDRLALDVYKWETDPKNPKNIAAALSETAVPKGVEYASNYGDLMDATNNAEIAFTANKHDLVVKYLTAINAGNGKGQTKEQVENAIKDYERRSPGFIDRMYGKALDVSTNPKLARSPLYADLMASIPTVIRSQQSVNELATITKNMNEDVGVRKAGGKEISIDSIKKDFKPFEITYTKDRGLSMIPFAKEMGLVQEHKATVTAQDALDFAIVNNYGEAGKTFKSTKEEQKLLENAEARLTAKFGVDPSHLISRGYLFGDGKNEASNKQLIKTFNLVKQQKFGDVLQAKENYLKNSQWRPQNVSYNIYSTDAKEAERKSSNDRVKAVLNSYKGAANVSEFDNLFASPNFFSAQIEVDRGTYLNPKESFKLNLYSGDEVVSSLPISRENAEYIKNSKINLPALPSQAVQRIKATGSTTNATGLSPNNPNAYQGALIGSSYFSQKFNTTKVKGADVVENGSGGYNAYLYTTDPATGNNIGIPVKASKGDIYPATFNTADAAEQYLLNEIKNKTTLDSLINNGL